MELDGLTSNDTLDARQYSMFCFAVAERFHWTLDYIREMALPDIYALMEYIEKTREK